VEKNAKNDNVTGVVPPDHGPQKTQGKDRQVEVGKKRGTEGGWGEKSLHAKSRDSKTRAGGEGQVNPLVRAKNKCRPHHGSYKVPPWGYTLDSTSLWSLPDQKKTAWGGGKQCLTRREIRGGGSRPWREGSRLLEICRKKKNG